MRISLFLLIAIFFSCKVNHLLDIEAKSKFVPPNGFEIGDKLFIDKSEVTNIDWKEYQYWNKLVFGKESIEYIKTTPDTTVWLDGARPDSSLMINYYRSPKYDKFPVVGVTQEQVMQYSNWRSDRVFEMLLINSKIIEVTGHMQDSSSYFTVEKYLSGNFFDYKPVASISFIPKFSLPSSTEITEINAIVKENIDSHFAKCKSKICKECKDAGSIVNSKKNHSQNYDLYMAPTRPSDIDCSEESFLEVHNLIGNVAEWTNGYLEVFGGSWQDEISNNDINIQKVDHQKASFIGFRNICKLEAIRFE